MYNPKDHYWIISGDAARTYASARAAFVPLDDATYVAWLAMGQFPTRIDSFDSLAAVLTEAGVAPFNVDDIRDARLATGFADTVTGKTWQCDDASQGKLTALGASAGLAIALQVSPAPTFDLIAADNSTATLSAADTFALINDRIFPWVSATMLYARGLKNQVNAGTPPADITAGWP